MMHHYHSWGLHIASALPCVGWPPGQSTTSAATGIRIEYGTAPKQLAQPQLTRALLQVNHQNVLIILPGVARVLVSGGESIIVQATPPPGHKQDTLALQHLLETNAIPALLVQRGLLLLRGSAVAIDGRAIGILGQTGAGTSTLAAALAAQGAKVLADGYCVIVAATDTPKILPGPPQLNLWGQALEWLGYSEEKATRLRPGQQRFRATFPGWENTQSKPLHALWYLAKQHDNEEKLTGQKAIQCALKLRQAPLITHGCGHSGTELVALGQVLKTVPLQPLSRPASLAAVADLFEHTQISL